MPYSILGTASPVTENQWDYSLSVKEKKKKSRSYKIGLKTFVPWVLAGLLFYTASQRKNANWTQRKLNCHPQIVKLFVTLLQFWDCRYFLMQIEMYVLICNIKTIVISKKKIYWILYKHQTLNTNNYYKLMHHYVQNIVLIARNDISFFHLQFLEQNLIILLHCHQQTKNFIFAIFRSY